MTQKLTYRFQRAVNLFHRKCRLSFFVLFCFLSQVLAYVLYILLERRTAEEPIFLYMTHSGGLIIREM